MENVDVQFQFDFPKTLAAITYIASQNVPELTVYKTLKIIFLSDKYHLVRYGRPITGDAYSALKDGPVPSTIYNLLKEIRKSPYTQYAKTLSENIEVDKNYEYPRLRAKKAYDADELSKSDIEALSSSIRDFGKLGYFELRDLAHEMAAFDKAWKSKSFFRSSAPMKFEDFFEGDKGSIQAAKAEMVENAELRKVFAKRSPV